MTGSTIFPGGRGDVKPGAPTLAAPVVGSQRLTLNWTDNNAGSAVLSHIVYAGSTTGTEVPIATIGADDSLTTYVDQKLAVVARYYKVSAVNAQGEGPLSNEVSATPLAPLTAPAAPTLANPTVGDGQATLTWTEGATGGSAILAHRVYAGGSAGIENAVAVVPIGDGLTYTHRGLTNNIPRFWRVSAINQVDEGALSNEVTGTPIGAALPQITLGSIANFTTATPAGTNVTSIGGLPSGTTPAVSPNDGRLAIGGSEGAGWTVLVGSSASSAGAIDFTISAAGAQSASAEVEVTTSSGGQTANQVLISALPANPLIGVLGGSRDRQDGVGISNTQELRSMSMGVENWARIKDRRFRDTFYWSNGVDANSNFMGGVLFANDGDSFNVMWQRIPAILASDVNLVWVDMTTNGINANDVDIYGNDLGVPLSVTGYCNLLFQCVDTLIAGGKAVGIIGLWERGTIAGGNWNSGAAARLLVPSIVSYAKTQAAARGVPFADERSVMIDTSTANNQPFAAYVRSDQTHRSTKGGKLCGDLRSALMATFLPAVADYDATAAGNMVSGGVFNNTNTGTVSGGGTGVAPAGVTINTASLISAGATVSCAVIQKNGHYWSELTVDALGMGSNRAAASWTFTAANASVGSWYNSRFRVEVDAGDGIIGTPYASHTTSTGAKSVSMAPTNDGGSWSEPFLQGPTEAWSGSLEGQPLKATSTTHGLAIVSPEFGVSTTGVMKIRICDVEARPSADPTLLMYDETDMAAVSFTSSASFTTPENSQLSAVCTTNKHARLSIGGGDSAYFRLDKWGRYSWYGADGSSNFPDFDNPLVSASGTPNVYAFTETATPFNPAVGAVSRTVTFTITNVNDGFTDTFNGYTGDPTLVPSPVTWTRGSSYAVDSTFSVTSSRLNASTTASGSIMFAPQQGDTISQDLTFQVLSTSTGFIAAVNLADDGSALGAQIIVGKIQIKKRQGSASFVQIQEIAPPLTLTGSKIRLVRIASTLYVYQSGVLIGTYDVTGVCDGTAGSTLAKKSGFISLTTTAPVDNVTVKTSDPTPPATKIVLKTLTLTNGTQTETGLVAGSVYGEALGNLTGAPSVAVTTDASALFYMDGVALRSRDVVPAGTYSITTTETNPNAANNNTPTTFTLTFS